MTGENLATRIRHVMQQEGLTQKDLAALLHISQPAVSLYLKGRMPPADTLYRIAQIGNCSVEWLLTGHKPKQGNMVVRETSSGYGKEALLLQLWQKLPKKIRQDVLTLLQHITERFDKPENR